MDFCNVSRPCAADNWHPGHWVYSCQSLQTLIQCGVCLLILILQPTVEDQATVKFKEAYESSATIKHNLSLIPLLPDRGGTPKGIYFLFVFWANFSSRKLNYNKVLPTLFWLPFCHTNMHTHKHIQLTASKLKKHNLLNYTKIEDPKEKLLKSKVICCYKELETACPFIAHLVLNTPEG